MIHCQCVARHWSGAWTRCTRSAEHFEPIELIAFFKTFTGNWAGVERVRHQCRSSMLRNCKKYTWTSYYEESRVYRCLFVYCYLLSSLSHGLWLRSSFGGFLPSFFCRFWLSPWLNLFALFSCWCFSFFNDWATFQSSTTAFVDQQRPHYWCDTGWMSDVTGGIWRERLLNFVKPTNYLSPCLGFKVARWSPLIISGRSVMINCKYLQTNPHICRGIRLFSGTVSNELAKAGGMCIPDKRQCVRNG